MTRQKRPVLLPWLEKRPLRALELSAEWPRLLDVVAWLVEHPRPGIYLRQVDLPGVHSKFIEAHRSVLTELLDLALPLTLWTSPKPVSASLPPVTAFSKSLRAFACGCSIRQFRSCLVRHAPT